MAGDEIGRRLLKERERLGLTQTEMGKAGGVGKTTQIKYEGGVSYPTAAYLEAMDQIDVDVLYVVTGNKALRSAAGISAEEQTLLDNYRELPEELQRAVKAMAQSLLENLVRLPEINKKNY